MAPISNLLLESMEDQGLPLHHDMFTNGEVAHGCGHALRTHHKGIRTTGADFITNDHHRSNIEILCETTVDEINFDTSSSTPRATSVTLLDKDGSSRLVKARKEIIVSGGAYCSPAILMRSGIGAKDELARHNISLLIDAPGVGKNLMDHLITFTFYETEKEGLTNDHLVYHGDGLMNSFMMYKEKKSGVLSTFPFGAFAFARLDERLNDEPLWQQAKTEEGRDPMGLTKTQPHIEFFTTELYGGPKQYDQFPIGKSALAQKRIPPKPLTQRITDKKHAFAMITELFSPHSRGTVTLASSDPTANPIISCNYLEHPLDLLVMTEGVRFGNEIVMNGSATKSIVKGAWPSDLTHHKFTERREWEDHVKREATTCYHAAGTCKMGREGDKMAVLDSELRVRGVEGLRVVDVSVMPKLHGGHTQMPAYGIGERGAELIREAWAKA